jgi:hypothetical protein
MYQQAQAPRYVAPHLRHETMAPQAPSRPQSSMSSISFATQVGGAPLPPGYHGYDGGQRDMPSSNGFTYTQNNAHMNGGDPFIDNNPYPRPAAPTRHMAPNMNGGYAPTPMLQNKTPYGQPNFSSGPPARGPAPYMNGGFTGAAAARPPQYGMPATMPQHNTPQHSQPNYGHSNGHSNGHVSHHMRSDSAQGGAALSLAHFIRGGATTDNEAIDRVVPAQTQPQPSGRRMTNTTQPSTPQRKGRSSTMNGDQNNGASTSSWLVQQPGDPNRGLGHRQRSQPSPPPVWLTQISHGYKPSLQEALAALPFHNPLRELQPSFNGVVKFCNVRTPLTSLNASE